MNGNERLLFEIERNNSNIDCGQKGHDEILRRTECSVQIETWDEQLSINDSVYQQAFIDRVHCLSD